MNETKETAATRRRYDRIAPVYDIMEGYVERTLYQGWRESLWNRVRGDRILEVGTGTGKNMNYYPEDSEIHAIDLSSRMLARAVRRAKEQDVEVHLHQMDVQHLEFGDDTFDSAVATFVFCSVPDARKGLGEIRRAVRPGGRVYLLEHMRSKTEWIARIMDLLDPITVRVLGPHINRRTVEAVRNAGLDILEAKELDGFGIFRRIEAKVPQAAPESAPIGG